MRLVLLGDPVGHSRSPAIFRAALAAAGIEGRYEALRVDAAGVYRAASEIRAGSLRGANVTMPHKAVAAAVADRLAPEAAAAGVVNTLVEEDGFVIGHNTDVGGLTAVRREGGLPAEAPVLVLGAGGAAAAALLAFRDAPLWLSARRPEAAAALAAAVGVAAGQLPWGRAAPGAVVVNATPLGMGGEALPAGLLEEAAGLVDLPYGDSTTPAVAEMRRRGRPVVDGLEVLVAQAAISFRIWTGREAPREAMRRAARAGG